jgi:2-dehydro-3-deoxygalactonokinase
MEDGSSPYCALVDWGTSSFRLWLVDADGRVLGERRSEEGMMRAGEIGFAAVLDSHLTALDVPEAVPVVISGMAGARQGWVEAPYVDLPASVQSLARAAVRVPHAAREVHILPGMAQNDADAPNVMRGEETQLAGIGESHVRGLVCMPGTHCKWVSLEDGRVAGMSSFMTGEIFAVLAQHSILKHAVDARAAFDAGHPVFLKAAKRALASPAQALGTIFEIRAGQLLGFERHEDGAAHLSGILIGSEIAAARERYGAGRVWLVASQRLAALYSAVMEQAGLAVTPVDGERAVRAGLLAAARHLHPRHGTPS